MAQPPSNYKFGGGEPRKGVDIMVQRRVAVLWILALVLAPSLGRSDDKPVRVADVPRIFEGEFEWRDGRDPYTLVLTIDKIEEKDGVIHFSGTHVYTPGDYKMKVEGTIDPKKRSISIRESDPSKADSETDGSFEGTISKNLLSIEAVWTSKDTCNKGDLKVKAKID
jgi:hypothetical protein